MALDYSGNTKVPASEATWEFIIMYTLTFACIVLFTIPFKIHFAHILWNLCQLHILISIFVQPLCIGHIILGLYRAACETGQFQAPMPKTQAKKLKPHQIQPLSVLPPPDVYLKENQARHMVTIQNDSLPTPSFATQSERKEIPTLSTTQETTIHANIAADTLVSQVTPLLRIMPRESTQLQNTNTQEDVKEILGTRAFQRYVDTPIQTLDGIIVNQPKCFLPLAQEARKIAEEIRIEKINEQWAGIP